MTIFRRTATAWLIVSSVLATAPAAPAQDTTTVEARLQALLDDAVANGFVSSTSHPARRHSSA